MIAQVALAEAALRAGKLRRAILRYYRRHGRRLPWRGERDPYRIWVSEIMLQQTQVVTVTKRYRSFIRAFPSVRTLASAPAARVHEAWAGLGYYARARNLHAAARAIVARHSGRIPADVVALQALPGVGRYTAGAVASIGFGKPVPVVDGNVARFLARLFGVEDPPARAAGARRLWAIAGKLVARASSPGEINQALMEVGACVCTPRAPRCGDCPVRRWCVARALGAAEAFPRRSAARAKRPVLQGGARLARRLARSVVGATAGSRSLGRSVAATGRRRSASTLAPRRTTRR